MRRPVRVLAAAGVAAMVLLAMPALAAAHPLGNFTINRYSRLEPVGDRLRVIYIVDMAEIPALQESATMDLDRDLQTDDAEKTAYADRKTEELRRGLRLTLDGAPAELALVSRELSFPPGQGGLATLRLRAVFEAPVPVGATIRADYRDENFSGRIGWKELVVRAGDGGSILESDAPSADQTDELRTYPNDMLASPLDRTRANFSFRGGGAGGTAAAILERVAPSVSGRASDAFADSLPIGPLTPSVVLLALLGAAFWGSLHALTPGHGKTVVAAYLIGSRGTPRHAAFLGLTVTVTHTLGVYALGLVTLFASQYVLPEQLYPWLGVISGLVVFGMGLYMVERRIRAWRARRHSHPADQLHTIPHSHGTHAHSQTPLALPALALVGVGAASVSTTLSTEDSPNHLPLSGDHLHHQDQHHPHDHDHDHDHDTNGHSHAPPGADGAPVTWRSLLALGISGGLLPCPSALVVMLSAIALGRVAFGLALVLAFSVGLAAVLIVFGLLLLYAGRLFSRIPTDRRVFSLIPVGSAAVILVLGIVVTAQSLAQTGLLTP